MGPFSCQLSKLGLRISMCLALRSSWFSLLWHSPMCQYLCGLGIVNFRITGKIRACEQRKTTTGWLRRTAELANRENDILYLNAGKGVENGSDVWVPATHMGDPLGVTGFDLTLLQLLWPFVEWTIRRKVSISPSPSLSVILPLN